MKHIPLTISIILLLCFYANAQQPQVDRGLVRDGTYVNNGFGFTYTYPKDWTVHGEATNERIREAGKQEIIASGALSKGSAEASLKNTHYLLTVFQHPVGTPGITFNPGVMLIAERVDHAPGIKTGKDYVLNTRAILKRTGAQISDEEPTEHRFGDWQFFRASYNLEVNRVPLVQVHFATVVKGYALLFIFLAQDEKSADEIAKSMETFASVPPVRRGVTTVTGPPPKPKPKPN